MFQPRTIPFRRSPKAVAKKRKDLAAYLALTGQSEQRDAIAIPKDWVEFARQTYIKSTGGVVHFEPYDWQAELSAYLDLNRPRSIIQVKSRQAGASEFWLSKSLYTALKNPGATIIICARTQADSWLLARRTRLMLEECPWSDQVDSDSLSLISFQNKSTIVFRSVLPESIRGIQTAMLAVIDEAAFAPDLNALLEAIYYCQQNAYKPLLALVSTPFGSTGHFYEQTISACPTLTEEIEDCITRNPFKILPPVDGGYTVNLLNWRCIPKYAAEGESFLERVAKEAGLTQAGIQQELELSFVESERNIFPIALIRSVESDLLRPIRRAHDGAELWFEEPDENAVYYAGGDPNGGSLTSGDYAALVILRKENDRFRLAYTYGKKSGTTASHLNRWANAIAAFSPINTQIEVNNSGYAWLEQMAGLLPGHSLSGGKTTEATRSQMITTITIAMEKGHLTIDKNGQLSQQLLSFILNANNKPEHAQGANDDLIFGTMHALAGAGYRG